MAVKRERRRFKSFDFLYRYTLLAKNFTSAHLHKPVPLGSNQTRLPLDSPKRLKKMEAHTPNDIEPEPHKGEL